MQAIAPTRLTFLAAGLLVPVLATADCTDPAGRVHANQLGFFDAASKLAIVNDASPMPVDWRLLDDNGEVRRSGKSQVFGADAVSGDHVHRIDFSDFEQSGAAYRLATRCASSYPFAIGSQPYGQLQYDALAYFYHNRSGVPIDSELAGGDEWSRPTAHQPDVATCRSDADPQGNQWPGCDYTLDATGGWYDAGDHGKYVVNGGISVWTLQNLYETQRAFDWPDAFRDGMATIPEANNGVNDLLDEARFEMEFLLRMQAPDGSKAKVPVGIKRSEENLAFTTIDASGMAHHKIADENWTALPMRPEDDREKRVLFPVSTAATLNLAASAAQCARIWAKIDEAFSGRCKQAALRAYDAATRNPEVYFVASHSGSGMYGDGYLGDEFFWAAAELYATTADRRYLDDLKASPLWGQALAAEPGWSRVEALGLLTLATVPSELPAADLKSTRDTLSAAAALFVAERAQSGYRIPYASDRYSWGSNSSLLNRAVILGVAFAVSGNENYRDAAIDVMDYLLGRNPLDQSYISGYGKQPMKYPHHRFWAPTFDAGLPPPPPGALSGGPNNTNPADDVARAMAGKCAAQRCWADDVDAFALNEVAINWNAPLVWVATFLSATGD